MSHLEQKKSEVIAKIQSLCVRCASGEEHNCPVANVIDAIRHLNGIPIVVNDRLHHVVFLQ